MIIGVSETIENKANEQKGVFLSMLSGTLGARLLGNVLTGQWVTWAGEGIVRAGKGAMKMSQVWGTVRAGQGF